MLLQARDLRCPIHKVEFRAEPMFEQFFIRGPHFINADPIAGGLSPFASDRAAVRAGRITLDEISRSAAEGDNFAFETTLSGLAYARRIALWRGEGYTVKLIFLKLSSVEEARWRGWRCGFDKADTTCPTPVLLNEGANP